MENIGAFLGKWMIGNTIPGGVLLHLSAVVTVAPYNKMSGQIKFTQATHPPLDITVEVVGGYVDTVIGQTKVHIARIHTAPPQLLGTPSVDLLVLFDENWQKGTAWFTAMIGSSHFAENDAPVVVEN
jgi:hypothetical protein